MFELSGVRVTEVILYRFQSHVSVIQWLLTWEILRWEQLNLDVSLEFQIVQLYATTKSIILGC